MRDKDLNGNEGAFLSAAKLRRGGDIKMTVCIVGNECELKWEKGFESIMRWGAMLSADVGVCANILNAALATCLKNECPLACFFEISFRLSAFPATFTAIMAEDLLVNWQKKSADNQKKYKQLLARANKNAVLKQLPDLHEAAFEKIDCLTCAACCKNYSPRFKTPDIKRISKYLGMKEGAFIETYLVVDGEGDYVVNQKPCPFLGEDNFCAVYEHRPSDCQRFPYTDEDVLLKRPQLTLKNSTFCPAVYFVLEKLQPK
jgi:uncharacterized protein